jgi:hypothetical protein
MPRRCEPDDRLRDAIQHSRHRSNLDCFVALLLAITSKVGASSPHERREGGVFPLPLGEGQGEGLRSFLEQPPYPDGI